MLKFPPMAKPLVVMFFTTVQLEMSMLPEGRLMYPKVMVPAAQSEIKTFPAEHVISEQLKLPVPVVLVTAKPFFAVIVLPLKVPPDQAVLEKDPLVRLTAPPIVIAPADQSEIDTLPSELVMPEQLKLPAPVVLVTEKPFFAVILLALKVPPDQAVLEKEPALRLTAPLIVIVPAAQSEISTLPRELVIPAQLKPPVPVVLVTEKPFFAVIAPEALKVPPDQAVLEKAPLVRLIEPLIVIAPEAQVSTVKLPFALLILEQVNVAAPVQPLSLMSPLTVMVP